MSYRTLLVGVSAGLLVSASGLGEGLTLPVDRSGALPRHLTPAEREYLAQNPITADLRAVTAPPTGPVHCAAEYEPMDSIMLSWQGSSSWLSISAQMAKEITTAGNADVWVAVSSASSQVSASNAMQAAGANMSRVKFVIRGTDSIWIRDYGPRYIFEGDTRAVVDHTYNRPRPNDDAYTAFYAAQRGHQFYELPLVHGGGNYHLDALDRSYATRLINNENPGLTEGQIIGHWNAYQNVNTTLFQPFPTSVDATQHLDMWMQIIADDAVMISDWPNNVGSTQDQICDAAAVTMAGLGYTVTRVPARSVNGTHYTYTNVVMCNDIVLIPSYTNGTVSPHNAQALAAWQSAMPNKQIIPINCQAIVTAAGVMHCIVMHVPKHRGAAGPNGGLAPTAYVKSLNGGEIVAPASVQNIRWNSDDDVSVASVDVHASYDGGVTWNALSLGAAALGSFNWNVPNVHTSQARVRVTARDALGNTGADVTDVNFRITGSCAGDATGDNVVNFADLNIVLSEFGQTQSGAGWMAGDVNGDGVVGFADLNEVLSLFGNPC